ncbi:hypothetical protein RDWZM_001615 [Blomia tropicalis]|uniref:Enolase-phosphatase E1 n=1 Tax=Blomia tropicalis TaxID=40697 RepID=A0A9Q0MGD0_BLOTA|nr:Enolase-phosphatase E1 [Blomia tropicalis]KAJ6223070.1 hypothetical protein RDWZM_001615 [Blomia tropicalis]
MNDEKQQQPLESNKSESVKSCDLVQTEQSTGFVRSTPGVETSALMATTAAASGQEEYNNSQTKQCAKYQPSVSGGFDAVVQEERKQRKQMFGPNVQRIIKPSNILIDIYGVISSWSFASDLKVYALDTMSSYLRDNWDSKFLKTMMTRLREQVTIDREAGIDVPNIAPDSATREDQIETASASIRWQMKNKHNTTKSQMGHLCANLWSQAYETGKLKTHAYPEVADAFHYWRFEEFIKIYSYASGSPDGQRLFLRSSVLGDLNRYVANALNASGGYKFDSDKFRSVASALRESHLPNLIYITDCPKKAKNAIKAGLRSIVVNRTGKSVGKYEPNNTEGLIVVTNLSDIQFIDDPNATPHMNCC